MKKACKRSQVWALLLAALLILPCLTAYAEDTDGQTAQPITTAAEIIPADEVRLDAAPAAELNELAEGWNKVDGQWFYVKDGILCAGGVWKIDGSYYGFDYSGVMYDDADFPCWDEETRCNQYYRAKAGGTLYVNEWYKNEWGTWYYYGAGGKAPEGPATVGGKLYYFEYGAMATERTVSADGKHYYADAKGTLTELKEGWNKADGKWFYLKSGELYKNSVWKIDGSYYGFDYFGVMYDDADFPCWDEENSCNQYYRAKAGGKLYVKAWYKNEWGTWYYYGAGGKAPEGPATVGGKLYFFYQSGQMAVDTAEAAGGKVYLVDSKGIAVAGKAGWNRLGETWFYISGGKPYRDGIYKIGGEFYGFGGNGAMFTGDFCLYDSETGVWDYYRAKAGGKLYVKAWYKSESSTWYYYGAGGKAPEGPATVSGKLYYFEYGAMATERTVSADGKHYYADAKGTLTELKEGWNKADGKWFYLKSGELYKNSVWKIDGSYYGFDYSGVMYDDADFPCWDEENSCNQYYRAKAGGKLYVKAWYKNEWGTWYYYGAGGKAPEGPATVGGKLYFFYTGGQMAVDTAEAAGGKVYLVDSKGIAVAGKAGWNRLGETWFYISGGKPYRDGIYKIGGEFYGFGGNGAMFTGDFCLYDSETGVWDYYRAKAGGTLYVKAWYKSESGTWYYYGAGGKAPEGLTTVSGKLYFFYTGGEMAVNTTVTVGGRTYQIGADGVATPIK